jgi:hypothetical protein
MEEEKKTEGKKEENEVVGAEKSSFQFIISHAPNERQVAGYVKQERGAKEKKK